MKQFFFFNLFLSLNLALFAQQKQIQYLSGTDNKHTVAWDFFCTGGRNAGIWTKIQVPSHWEQQGFGSYNYGRDYKTNGKNARFWDEKGLYKYSFTVPAAWKGKKVFLVFEGAMTDTEVKVNGKIAGAVHQGSFYRFKYDVTDKIKFGAANLLEATVSKMSADASVNNAERLADYWVFGGIYRPVYLEAVPQQSVDCIAIDAKHNGSFAMQVFPNGLTGANVLIAEIFDANGKKIKTLLANAGVNDSAVKLTTNLTSVKQWTSETPNLQWKNRLQGTPVNVWQNLYNNTHTSYNPIVYPEFKGYYGDVSWMEFNTVEGKFYVASKDTGLYVRLFDFYALSGPRPHPELPVGNISFLDCIPPIGTKLALGINTNTSALGPQSEPTMLSGPIKRSLLFYFGLPKTTNTKEQYSRPDVDQVF